MGVDRRTPSSPLLPYDLLKPQQVIMVVPDSVKEKVGELPDVSGMSKDDLAALVKQLYDQSCSVFGEKFPHGVRRQEEGHGDPQPRDGDQRVPRHLQDPQAEEGEQVQDDGR